MRIPRVALLAGLLFALALIPRITGLGGFLTTDEPQNWFVRAQEFRAALEHGDFAQTNLTGHPGVVTMWLGAAGLVAHDGLAALGWLDARDPVAQRVFLRMPVALVTALCVGLAYPMLRRLFDRRVALLAALFWATDPFLVAHSRVLHLDALLASFMSLALLAALVALAAPSDKPGLPVRWGWLIAAAVAGGLALLTKSPAALLLPMIGLIALGRRGGERRGGEDIALVRPVPWNEVGADLRPYVRRWLLLMLVWCGVAGLTWLVFWPAAWVALPSAVGSVVNEVVNNGGVPHFGGNFFLGQVDQHPGWFYYPVAVALRLTPWVSIGLLLTAGAGVAQFVASRRSRLRLALIRSTPVLLALFVAAFLLMMSIPPKKFDRYVLPVFPALNILAALGWIWLLDQMRKRWRMGACGGYALPEPVASREPCALPHPDASDHPHRVTPSPGHNPFWWASGYTWLCIVPIFRPFFIWLLLTLALLANLMWYHPYALAYYNPLVGGSNAAVRAMYVGWGEGLEQAGAFIVQQFNGCDRPVAAQAKLALADFVCSDIVPMDAITVPGKVDYAVLYVSHLQREIDLAQAEELLRQPPLHTVQIHGIDYAYVYQIPQPVAHTLDATFGPAIALRGYDLDASRLQSSGLLTVTVQWQARASMTENYGLFMHMLNSSGTLVAQADVPPGGPRAPTSVWLPGQFVDWVHPVPVPADLPPGTYWLALGIYDPQTFARLPLHGPAQPGAPADGANALLLPPLVVP